MNSKRKGSVAVGAAISYFSSRGITVLLPIADCDIYDLAIDDGNIKKIQCKYTDDKETNGRYNVDLRTFGGYRNKTYYLKYKNGDFDLLFIYCGNGNKYLIPAEKIISKSHLVVGLKSWNEFKLNAGVAE